MSTSSYPSSIDGNVVRRLRQDIAFVEVEEDEEHGVTVRMASKQHPLCNFVDEDDEIELYVTFTQQVRGVPWNDRASSSREETDDPSQYAIQVDMAGKMVPMEPLICLRRGHAQMYKAAIKVGAESVSLRAGDQVPFALQYYDYRFGADTVREINSVTPPNRPVYYQPVWSQLKERDGSLRREISVLEGSDEIFDQRQGSRNAIEEGDSREQTFSRSETPVQLAKDDYFLYYTRKACSPFLKSQNPFLKFIKELMVTPLTNFTGLSLYYQLYLVEIFHVKFLTKAGHYLSMPVVVLLMATWFAQWRFKGCYKTQDFSIFILNGTAIFVLSLQAWYLVWGCLYRMFLFGAFMIWPLAVTYILANIIFQLIVINSMWVRESHITVTDVVTCWGQNSSHWYDFITLQHYGVVWYFHPLFWALVFSAFQALSHLFEDKLPPRVSQTAHWLDLTTILKQNGFVSTSLICVSQVFFGTLNEFFASPRLLPLLILRICYTMGYKEVPWLKFRLLVDECLKYGDPAIDYIGRGGAEYLEQVEQSKPEKMANELQEIELGLSKELKEGLKDPEFLKDETCFTPSLKYYVCLRHRLAKYRIQVNAYGPFTRKEAKDQVQLDHKKMKNDFPHDPSFRLFLEEVRSHFSEMEWNFVNECKFDRLLR